MTDLPQLRREISRRRTFAIISHPDAGKTTLTEKLLLLGGAIQTAGAVKAKRSQSHVASDWMEIERKRGISTSTSVMSFEYNNHQLNLLDTPGHADFSEDTYRTLAAVDAAVLLIDVAKGVERQTEKLFKVCSQRGIPIFVFFNKMDRYGREPLELLDEIEEVLGIRTTVVNWPVGSGKEFRGVYDRREQRFHSYVDQGKGHNSIQMSSLGDETFVELTSPAQRAELEESLELIEGAGEDLDPELVLAGKLAPAFFGSALSGFGVDLLLDAVLSFAPPPLTATLRDGSLLPAEDPRFTGLIFKIQANMNPHHRDRLAFCRVVSGSYETGLTVHLNPRGKKTKLGEPKQVFARQRTAVTEAFPGDVIGLFDPGIYRVGDTITVDPNLTLPGIPFFPAEKFAVARVRDASFRKSFQKGLTQLAEEGAIQVFRDPERLDRDPVLAAVGQLQFDVFVARLQSEYNVPVKLEAQGYVAARWISGEGFEVEDFRHGVGWSLVLDRDDRPVLLFKSTYWLGELAERHAGLILSETSGAATT